MDKAKKNARERARYALSRAQNIELARLKDRDKARRRRKKYAAAVNQYDRVRYAKQRDEVRARRAERYAQNAGGMRDRALAYQKVKYLDGSMVYRIRLAVNAAKARAKVRGIDFDITADDLGAPTHCAVTGIKFDLTRSFRSGNTFVPSLDRIDPAKGYVRGNVRVVIHAYNLAKHTGTDEAVLVMARALIAATDRKTEAA